MPCVRSDESLQRAEQLGSASGSEMSGKATDGAEYPKGIVVFTMAKGGLIHAATIAGQRYSY
jgi:hypothetical protein